jgi:hypothetical protein
MKDEAVSLVIARGARMRWRTLIWALEGTATPTVAQNRATGGQ